MPDVGRRLDGFEDSWSNAGHHEELARIAEATSTGALRSNASRQFWANAGQEAEFGLCRAVEVELAVTPKGRSVAPRG